LGPNGAGKTTTIRQLMGFLKPDAGVCSIGGLNCWEKAPDIQKMLGYVPGETAFLNLKGMQYLNFLKEKFSGEEQLMIAAYNAGHNKVEEWLSEGYSKNGTTLDEIPYAETKNYVDKVNKAYAEYQKLYEIK
jgi:ABC-type multidrug transport system ATPase subunit